MMDIVGPGKIRKIGTFTRWPGPVAATSLDLRQCAMPAARNRSNHRLRALNYGMVIKGCLKDTSVVIVAAHISAFGYAARF
jgi:hypothetical protein